MSGYNNQGGYGQSYPQQPQYGQPQGYAPQQSYSDPNQYPQQPQQGYGAQEFGPPRRQDSYGPPSQGGFQHGQAGGTYGTYDASNPQGHAGYYGGYPETAQQQQYGQQPQYGQGQTDAFAANQAYQNQLASGGAPSQAQAADHQFAAQSTDPQAPNYNPNAPPMTEQDRGLLGALGGGFAGHHFGGKQGHGILGTLGGAIAGSFAEDFLKKKKHSKPHGGSSASSWGGGSKW